MRGMTKLPQRVTAWQATAVARARRIHRAEIGPESLAISALRVGGVVVAADTTSLYGIGGPGGAVNPSASNEVR
jgi:hypothetical protein